MSISADAMLTVTQIRAVDRAAIAAGLPGIRLMEAAGEAVADAALRRLEPGAEVLVLCGPGANGGDGFVAARLLRERGMIVSVALAGRRESLSGDAALVASSWPGEVLVAGRRLAGRPDLIIDALFGAGLGRPLTGDVAALVEAVNDSGIPVLAVDLPSGVDGDTGQVRGCAIRAVETVTFVRPKPGHRLCPGRGLCGAVTVADIGIRAEIIARAVGSAPPVFLNRPEAWLPLLPEPAPDAHKFRRGAVLVMAGGIEGTGAPRLSAVAALRIGAGLATIACRPDAVAAHASRGPDALMVRGVADAAACERLLAEQRLGAVVAGPALGLDAAGAAAVEAVLGSAVPAVLDADALTLLGGRPDRLAGRKATTVLTPHEGEFARLFGAAEPYDNVSKLDRVRNAADRSGCVVLLKGPDTVIAAPGGRAAINDTGDASLATAGSGDVLAGCIGGLMAQGMPAFEAACAAAWLHGKAGAALGFGLIADELPDAIHRQRAALVTRT